mmetsp:Transcript_75975/g.134172  ORF Transcript_75975/g.134172 Transcript_75975/m.134172 type:complete len:116 (-) Transcript_75975:559-906(-)
MPKACSSPAPSIAPAPAVSSIPNPSATSTAQFAFSARALLELASASDCADLPAERASESSSGLGCLDPELGDAGSDREALRDFTGDFCDVGEVGPCDEVFLEGLRLELGDRPLRS